MSIVAAERYHDISCGHRVVGHESKCAFLHGHNYRVHFSCMPLREPAATALATRKRDAVGLDSVGRVIDFSAIKSRLCDWIEANWDHKFLAWEHDPVMLRLQWILQASGLHGVKNSPDAVAWEAFNPSVVWVPFNPTAENMAKYLVQVVGPRELQGTGTRLVRVKIDETRKCSALFYEEGE